MFIFKIFPICTLLLLSSCVGQSEAPIEFKNVESVKKLRYLSNDKKESSAGNKKNYVNSQIQKNDFYNNNFLSNDAYSDPNLENEYEEIYHEVVEGETLSQIAAKYGCTVNEIAKINMLIPPYHLEVLQILTIKKVKGSILSKSKFKYHPVDNASLIYISLSKGCVYYSPLGARVISVARGKVLHSDYNNNYGNILVIRYPEYDLDIAYCHLQDILVQKGEHVEAGQLIGYVGKTGKVERSQLAIVTRKNNKFVDPRKFLPK